MLFWFTKFIRCSKCEFSKSSWYYCIWYIYHSSFLQILSKRFVWLVSESFCKLTPSIIRLTRFTCDQCMFIHPTVVWNLLSISFRVKASNSHLILIFHLWVFRCMRSPEFQQKAFPHSEHFHGFSPVWTLWCSLRDDFWVNAFPHSVHLNGFSPECVFWCIWSEAFRG